jgi:serine/threonine protein phosphatase PrpC
MNCLSCNTIVLQSDKFCEECGAPLQATVSASPGCQKCGTSADRIDTDGFCMDCGVKNTPQSPRLTIEVSPVFAGASDPGCRYRHNEDAISLKQLPDGTAIILVCDGVSSSGEAAQASNLSAQQTSLYIESALTTDSPSAALWQTAIAATHETLRQTAPVSALEPPSTTLVGAIVQNYQATIAWVGDSRAYWIDDTAPQLLTLDHSWMNDVVAAGEMSLEAARRSPKAHAITRWLGADATEHDAEPSIKQFNLPGAGYLILCSDGLWNYAPEAIQLKALIDVSKSALAISQQMVEYARSSGGHDNITVAILQIPPRPD